MTQAWNKDDHEHVRARCPRAAIVLNIWRDSALYGKLIPEPNRYRLPANTRRSPAHAGFYKLDTEKV